MGCGGSGILTVCGPLGLSERFRLLNLESFVFRKKEAGGMLLVNLEWYFSLIKFVLVDDVAYGNVAFGDQLRSEFGGVYLV